MTAFQMSNFERVGADLNVDHHTVCGGGTPSAFLLEGPRNTEAGHTVTVTFHKHVSCNREVRTTRWGSLTIYKPVEPRHELAPPLGREIVLGIYQAVAIALIIIQRQRNGLLREIDKIVLIRGGGPNTLRYRQGSQKQGNETHHPCITHHLHECD